MENKEKKQRLHLEEKMEIEHRDGGSTFLCCMKCGKTSEDSKVCIMCNHCTECSNHDHCANSAVGGGGFSISSPQNFSNYFVVRFAMRVPSVFEDDELQDAVKVIGQSAAQWMEEKITKFTHDLENEVMSNILKRNIKDFLKDVH